MTTTLDRGLAENAASIRRWVILFAVFVAIIVATSVAIAASGGTSCMTESDAIATSVAVHGDANMYGAYTC